MDFKNRTLPLYGNDVVNKISKKTVAILGLGGVGCSVCDSLCRFGVSNFILMDFDVYDQTNLNRQLYADTLSIGKHKCDVAKRKILDINPSCNVEILKIRYDESTKDVLFKYNIDMVIDCIDTLSSKIILALKCKNNNIPLISCLGAGNRIDPTKFKVDYIENTKGISCNFTKTYRKLCEKNRLDNINVLYSTELPKKINIKTQNGRHTPASSPFCPPVAGYIIASHAIKELSL